MAELVFETLDAKIIYNKSFGYDKIKKERNYLHDWRKNFRSINLDQSEDEIYQQILKIMGNGRRYAYREVKFLKSIVINSWYTVIDLLLDNLIISRSILLVYICRYTNNIEFFEKYNEDCESNMILYYGSTLFFNKCIPNELSVHIETKYVATKEDLSLIFKNKEPDINILSLVVDKFNINFDDFKYWACHDIVKILLINEQHDLLQKMITDNVTTESLLMQNINKLNYHVADRCIDIYFPDDKENIYCYMINKCDNLETFLYWNEYVDPDIDLIFAEGNIDIIKWILSQGYRSNKSYIDHVDKILNIILEYDFLDSNYDEIVKTYRIISTNICCGHIGDAGINIMKKLIELSNAKLIDLHFDSDILLFKAIMYEKFHVAKILIDNGFELNNRDNLLSDAKLLSKQSIIDFVEQL